MKLGRIVERISEQPGHRLCFYAEGLLGEKSFVDLHQDVMTAVDNLRRWNVAPRTRVGLLATNCYEWIVYDLALIHLKCVSVIFPEEFGLHSSAELMDRYDLALLLLSRHDRWPGVAPDRWTAFIDADCPNVVARKVTPRPPEEDGSHSLAFSSGTSGRIKCLIINDAGTEESIASFYHCFPIQPDDHLLVFLPLSSYQQRLCVYAALFYGFSIGLAKPSEALRAFKDMKPTLCLAPPLLYESVHSQFRATVRSLGWPKRALAGALDRLAGLPLGPVRRAARAAAYARVYASLGGRMRIMWTGMAPIKRSALEFFERLGISLYEAYALNECGVVSTNTASHRRLGSVGQLVDPGSVTLAPDGEIIVRKTSLLTKGYIECGPGEEAATYVGPGTVATGDIGHFDADGYLYIVGRKKQILVTSQGFKVQPEPIETRIEQCPLVERACLFGSDLPYLVALVSIRPPQTSAVESAIEETIRQVNQELPTGLQIRRTVLTTEAFTLEKGFLTRNLKLDRRALFRYFQKEIAQTTSDGAATGSGGREQPMSETEARLAEIWSEVLSVRGMGRNDNFFALGGDSILATQVASRLREVFQVDMPFRTIFEASTLAELAKRVEDLRRQQESGQHVSISRRPRDGTLPLSFAQQRLWILHQIDPNSVAYNVPGGVRLNGPLSLDALTASLNEIARRHEVLRTTFQIADKEPVQVIAPVLTVPVTVLDRRAMPPAEQEAEIRRLASEEARQPFDLTRGPLIRGVLIRLAPEEHVLLVTLHHIVADGWSLGLFVREFSTLYNAFVSGKPSPLPELPIQYADFAAWQREWLQGEVLERQLDYWRQQLHGAPGLLDLPTDRPRPAVRTFEGATRSFMIPAPLREKLKALSLQQEVTLFMTLLAAFTILLQRYTRQDDILIGSPIANRNRAEIEDLIGFFVNTLVLRTDLSGDPTFEEFLGRLKEITLSAYSHQDLPFEKLVEELHPERSMRYSPVFQVMFVHQNSPSFELDLAGLVMRPLAVHSGTSKFDLVMELTEEGSGLQAILEYDTALFDTDTIGRMLEHYAHLLESIVAAPRCPISEYPILSTGERQLLLASLSARPRYPEACLHHRFESQVRRNPEATAVVHEGETLTYGELSRRANRLAHRLRAMGIGADTLVGLCMERSMDLIVGLLGILKAGAGYVPLDPSYPKERLAFMLEDAKVAALVIRRSVEDALPEHHLPVLRLDADENSLAAESTEEPSTGVGPDNLAYVIYTSGSTGKPKGVMITHANASRLFEATYERFRFDETDVWTLFHSFAFDFSVWEIWGALLYGGRLVVVPFWISRSPIAFLDLLAAERVTVLNQTPSAFQQLMAADEEAGGTARLALRLVIFGGEALDLGSLKPWFERRSDQRPQLANMYGITETTVHVTYRSLTAQDAEGGRGSCIGRPIPDLQLYLLDTRLEPVPIGVSGEIYVGGAGVARGYLGRPDLTADKFVPDPFSAEPGARLYRSGDLARRLGDGDVEYLGRIDDQLKIRGFRIETGEIESTLGQHPAVRQSVVRAYAPAPGDTRLAAYVVPDPQHAFPLRQMLRLEAEGRLEGRTLYELPNGMAVAYLNRSETDFLYKEIFEGNAYLRHGIRLRPGDCVFDVGANIGVSVLFFASRHPEVTVYAFEPLRPIFEVLALNLELYGVSGRAFPFGLSSERGTAEFTYYPYASVISGQFADVAAEQDTVKTFLLNEQRLGGGANGIAETAFDELLSVRLTTEIQTCELRTLSEILREHPVKTIDLLKVDVEKGEEAVLQGILDEDWPLIRQVAIEVHDIDGRLDRVKRLLQGKGFKLAVHQDTSFRGTALFNLYGVRRSQAESPAVAAPEAESAVLPAPGWSSRKALAGELRAFLQKVLPDHMIPSMFTFLESMPLTVNGKINYQSLPAPSVVGSDRDGFKEALQTRTEEVLARIWAEILAVERVGRQDNFFELGGHSLLATQLVARMTKAFDIEFPLRAVFEYPTLAALSDHVDMVRWVADSSSGAVLAMGPQEEGEL